MPDLVGVPKPGPDIPTDPHALVEVGVFVVLIIGFFCLIDRGLPPHEALGLTITLGLGGAQVVQRLRGRDHDRSRR